MFEEQHTQTPTSVYTTHTHLRLILITFYVSVLTGIASCCCVCVAMFSYFCSVSPRLKCSRSGKCVFDARMLVFYIQTGALTVGVRVFFVESTFYILMLFAAASHKRCDEYVLNYRLAVNISHSVCWQQRLSFSPLLNTGFRCPTSKMIRIFACGVVSLPAPVALADRFI